MKKLLLIYFAILTLMNESLVMFGWICYRANAKNATD